MEIKKRKLSGPDSASLSGWEPPATQPHSTGDNTVGGMPRQARKRHTTSPSTGLFSPSSAKKKRYARDDDASLDIESPCLSGEDKGNEGRRLDGQRNQAKKRSCPSLSGSEDSCPCNKKLKQFADTASRTKPFDDEERDLKAAGVRIMEKREVDAMTNTGYEVLGEGMFGSCIKAVDPDTQREVVIKTFHDNCIDRFFMEVMNLQYLQIPGVQHLMGVCVDTC